jgi:hypothetical protein
LARVIVAQVALMMALLAAGASGGTASADVSQRAHLADSPKHGPGGTMVLLRESGLVANEPVTISFIDSNGQRPLESTSTDERGRFSYRTCIPADATVGMDTIVAVSIRDLAIGTASFRVLSTGPRSRRPSAVPAGAAGISPQNVCV